MYEAFVGWGAETTWGTPVARTAFARQYGDSTMDHEVPQEAYGYLASREAEVSFLQAQRGMASMVIPASYVGMERLLEHCMGSRTPSGAGPYTHTFNVDDAPYTRAVAPLVGLTIENYLGLPDASLGSLLLYGARCKSFGSQFRANEQVRFTSEWVGKQVVQAAKTASPTFPNYASAASSPLVKWTQIVMTIDGTGSAPIYGIDWTVGNNLKEDKVELGGGGYISAPRAQGKRDVTGTIEKEWITAAPGGKALYDKFVNNSSASILATCTGPGSFTMTVRFNNVRFTGKTPQVNEGEDTNQTLPWKSYLDSTYRTVQIVVQNDTQTPA